MAGSRSGGKVTADGADDGVAEGDAVTLGEGGGVVGDGVNPSERRAHGFPVPDPAPR
jgi:hypothetical protein